MIKIKLKECPFCASEDIQFGEGFGFYDDFYGKNYYCFCNDCEASTRPGGTKRAAATKWNRRKSK